MAFTRVCRYPCVPRAALSHERQRRGRCRARQSARVRSCFAPPAPPVTAPTARAPQFTGRLRRSDSGFHRLLLRYARSGGGLDCRGTRRRAGARLQPPDAGVWRSADGGRDRAHRRLRARPLRRPGVAPRRVEFSARARHRKGVPGKRDAPHDDRSRPATRREFTNEVLYERRFGARNQFEVAVPLAMQASEGGQWFRGLGDVAVAVKRVLFHSLHTGTILSAGGEVVLPTGKENGGPWRRRHEVRAVPLGRAGAARQRVRAGAGRRRDSAAPRARRTKCSGAASSGRRSRRASSAAAGRRCSSCRRPRAGAGQPVEWDVLPQMQVSLSKRQHILVAAACGFRSPSGTGGRRRS